MKDTLSKKAELAIPQLAVTAFGVPAIAVAYWHGVPGNLRDTLLAVAFAFAIAAGFTLTAHSMLLAIWDSRLMRDARSGDYCTRLVRFLFHAFGTACAASTASIAMLLTHAEANPAISAWAFVGWMSLSGYALGSVLRAGACFHVFLRYKD